jgi:hemerythrin superfamily protein
MMARTQSSTTHRKSKTKARRRNSREPAALSLLKKQHAEVDKLFKRFEKAKDGDKAEIVQTACRALTIHAQLEEEIFYPALRDAGVENDLLDEAEVEHAGVKRLVGELDTMEPGDELYEAKVTVLAEYVKHHVKEEETEMFPDAKKSGADLDELGERMEARTVELQGQTDA